MFSAANFGYALMRVIDGLLSLYVLLIIVRAVISWFSPNPYNELYRWLIRLTEPVLAPLRRIIPLQGIDISPIIAILLIDLVLKRLLLGLLGSIFLP